ncbi:C2H2 finger domain protein [Talaromyces pinophilus]|uniref:C2H2 finger domain protein n=1 Tax=Talaromyces pinophilus TaxID=128442 RepID=A0A0B8MY37_TALPI|nr:C2H2 finger domain protein [Talaromyces pinophilus]
MEYTNSNTSAGLNFQGQPIYSVSNAYEPYGSRLHNEYGITQSKHTLSTESGAGMGVAVGLRHNMGLGITNVNTNNSIGMGMNMNMFTNAIGDMTSGTSSPYGDIRGTMLNAHSYLSPPHTLTSHQVRSSVPCSNTVVIDGVTSASSTRPIAIPLPKHHFRSAPQLALSPSVQSSPPEYPWSAYYYSASPAASASPMSYQSDDFAHRRFGPMNSSQPIPVSPAPSTPESVPSPASLADRVPAEGSPLLQRVRRKKPTHSFECQKCGKAFTRGADVKRHESSVHSPQPMDCPVENCVRKGSIGFPRRDHLMEHLRTFHNHDIPKRNGNRKRKARAMLDA